MSLQTSPLSSKDIAGQHISGGRVQILDGKLVYSPNCLRALSHIPTISEDPTSNIFLPSLTRERNPHYNFSSLQLSDYQQPQWWTLHWGWASFISCYPRFTGHIFGTLSYHPRAHELIESQDPVSYSMPDKVACQWSALEGDIYRICHHLGVLMNKPIVKPVLPFSFGYKKTHSSRSKALFAIEQSRRWFVVWMGLLAYLVAQAHGKTEQDTEQTDLLSYLASKGCNTAWLEAFSLSDVFDFADGTRAGTFVDAQKRAYSQPSIEWLCEFGVPVWYIWYPEYNEITQMKGLSPPCHEVQSVATIVFTSPSTHSSFFNSPKSPISRRAESWQEFFAAREERNKRTQTAETDHQRQCRLNREENPPQTAKVFEWVKDISGTLVREPVAQRERAGRMAIYAKDQIRYDSFANEYDCCEEFGPGFKQWRSLEEGRVDYDVLSTIDNEVILSEMLKGTPTSLSVAIENDDISEWLPRHVLPVRGQSTSDRAEEEILETLRLYCGFTPPLPCPDGSPISSIADQHNFLKFIGIPWKSCPVDIFAKPRIIAAVGFVRRLSIQSAIPDDQWDLNRCHTEYLGHSVRLKSLRIVRQVTDRSKMFYMFDFEPHNTDEWKLTMTSASDAMLVCRLDLHMDKVDIALFLVQNGVPFYTVRLSDSLQPTPSKNRHHLQPAVEYPYRSAGYQFTIDDYAVYIERTTRLLSGPMGRIALMKGGYLWRLAVTVVSFESVLTGPVVRSDEEFLVVTDSGEQYCDNELTPQELEILSGVYHCRTGQGNQIAKRSWYPTPQKHEYSGQDYGRWTSNSEVLFDLFKSRNSTSSDSCLQRQPLPGNKWRDATRGSGELRRAKLRMENTCLTLISFACSTSK